MSSPTKQPDAVTPAEQAIAQPVAKTYAQADTPDRAFHLVNPAGAIHLVTREHARARLKADARYRLASDDEIAAYEAARGHQVAGRPLARPHAADLAALDAV